jgi:hypothetical protein
MVTPAPHTSTITTATVRVAGPIQPDITVSHLGTPEQQAGLRVGELWPARGRAAGPRPRNCPASPGPGSYGCRPAPGWSG